MKQRFSKYFYAIVVFVFCSVCFLFFLNYKNKEHILIQINQNTINSIVAKTPQQLAKGLSGTKPLKENEGMWFIFPESGYYPFWMKDMNYSIDIVWINESYRIVYIKENATPDSYPNSFVSKEEAKYVLEVKSGYVKTHDISVGEYIMIH